MVNLNKLAGKIREKKKTQHDIAVLLKVSDTTISAKMTGRIKFDVDQAYLISVELGMTDAEIRTIFFSDQVA